MSHPFKDVLFIKYKDEFYCDVFGSPAGEINKFIETPDLNLLCPLLWKGIDWDFIIIDTRFSYIDYHYFIKNNFNNIKEKVKYIKIENLYMLKRKIIKEYDTTRI